MDLKLYNTLTKTKEVFQPADPKNVRLYVCGPTVYDYAHIGNARPAIVFDVLFRLLRHTYGENHVTYVRNITDVDDKINARAAEEGVSIRDLTERTNAQYQADVAALGCLAPTHQPRATENIAEMIRMIGQLIAARHAYAADGHVLYDVSSKADYGKLARRSLDEMIAGARVDVAPYKRGAMDFVLWKPSTPELPGWESPWGRGRPGWHIECSAMSERLLGENFDIHGGGIDLVFPHHENEIAQSEGAHGGKPLARVWMHNGFLQVEGQKMSKSLGNFVTIQDLLATKAFGGREWPGDVLRLAMLRTQYRQPIDWTVETLKESGGILTHWLNRLLSSDLRFEEANRELYAQFAPGALVLEALSDDLNLPAAITEIHRLASSPDPRDLQGLFASLRLLGVASFDSLAALRASVKDFEHSIVGDLIKRRSEVRAAKDFKEADRIRAVLESMGVQLKDAKDPKTGEIVTTWELKR